jgi:hypothetical protein
MSMDIGTESLHDIEGCVEMMRQKVLPEIEGVRPQYNTTM